ncbi:Ethanolamine ammonia-lyase heavy chain [Eubacterium maltosivorans]|uniref:ethanolamine ammonia-lyase subunit EutB n=1 Tax=Eubacterium TaxID=1730 RepID=UPI00088847A6|nr:MULTISPECIES: ethanolamine ammonia-lyase subunit EutB [Eubacterium]MDO5433203.1 ethanolamine ammonia-lyase subunit EutB [Eubacterium sp.]WPK78966.1 Ethanolamine ammonia-lyase heavy chain [Eubacterium maltosivorans]SDP69161.1 Ethanolamine ammonia-lyase heavy chain [Eubacterium maltosivorans]
MRLKTKLFGKVYQFDSVNDVLAKANEQKSGDILAGIAAESEQERVAAKEVLSNLLVSDIRNNPCVPYEEDEVTRIIQDDVNEAIYSEFKNMTISDLREYILDYKTSELDLKRMARGITSEVAAAVGKLMGNMDLIYAAQKIRVEATCNTTIGKRGILASRIQPNHPTDDPDSIKLSLYEGLSYGCGDAVLGLNPVDDTIDSLTRSLNLFDEIKRELEIPTQICVLGHITTQIECLKNGVPMDLMFQSLAGTEKANSSFGIDAEMLQTGKDLMLKQGTSIGPNVMYFETGQGSELSAEAHHGVDQMTLEARCYGLAKRYQPYLVNTVVGFIGPEYLYDGRQVIRAALEDHFMGKIQGIPMGVDSTMTCHMDSSFNDLDMLESLLALAGCNYFMGINGGDDVMLNHLTSSYHDMATLREMTNKKVIPEFGDWCRKWGIMDENDHLTELAGDASIFFK